MRFIDATEVKDIGIFFYI